MTLAGSSNQYSFKSGINSYSTMDDKVCVLAVSGMLLYAQTDEDVIPNNTYQMSGNQISVHALNLSQNFSEITKDLDSIVKVHF